MKIIAVVAYLIAAVVSVLITIVYLTVLWFCFRLWVGWYRSLNLPGLWTAFRDTLKKVHESDYTA
jgi:hypothetical protein